MCQESDKVKAWGKGIKMCMEKLDVWDRSEEKGKVGSLSEQWNYLEKNEDNIQYNEHFCVKLSLYQNNINEEVGQKSRDEFSLVQNKKNILILREFIFPH